MTFTSPLPSVSFPPLSVTVYTLERANRFAGKAAFIDGTTGRTMTYAEFDDEVRRQAGGWLEHGLAKGEVVAVMAPNCAEYSVVFHAVALAGGVLTTVNPTYTAGEVHHQLVDSGATRLVTIPAFLETATAGIADSAVREIYVIGEADGYPSISSLARRRYRSRNKCRSISTTLSCCRTRRGRRAWRRASCSRTATSSRTSSRRSARSRCRRTMPSSRCCRSFTSTACRCS